MKYIADAGGRKWLLALLAFLTFTGLLLADKLDQGAYLTLAMFALGGYLAANVTQKGVTRPPPKEDEPT